MTSAGRGILAGGRYRSLFGLVYRNASNAAEWTTGPKLRWAPPAQSAPTILTLPQGFFDNSSSSWTNTSGNGRGNGPRAFADDEDVIVQPFAGTRTSNSDCTLVGGRHVRVIGGHYQGRVKVDQLVGSVFLEGLRIALVAKKDAINVLGKSGSRPDVYLQNSHVTGVFGVNADANHSDILQLQGPIGTLRVHRFTGDSNYQGLYLRPEFPITAAVLSDVNLKFNAITPAEGNTFLLWLRDLAGATSAGDPLYPVELTRGIFVDANAASPSRAAAFPPPGQATIGEPSAGAYAGMADADGNLTWPAGSGITGQVRKGQPVFDFVIPGGSGAGSGYVSPGYSAT